MKATYDSEAEYSSDMSRPMTPLDSLVAANPMLAASLLSHRMKNAMFYPGTNAEQFNYPPMLDENYEEDHMITPTDTLASFQMLRPCTGAAVSSCDTVDVTLTVPRGQESSLRDFAQKLRATKGKKSLLFAPSMDESTGRRAMQVSELMPGCIVMNHGQTLGMRCYRIPANSTGAVVVPTVSGSLLTDVIFTDKTSLLLLRSPQPANRPGRRSTGAEPSFQLVHLPLPTDLENISLNDMINMMLALKSASKSESTATDAQMASLKQQDYNAMLNAYSLQPVQSKASLTVHLIDAAQLITATDNSGQPPTRGSRSVTGLPQQQQQQQQQLSDPMYSQLHSQMLNLDVQQYLQQMLHPKYPAPEMSTQVPSIYTAPQPQQPLHQSPIANLESLLKIQQMLNDPLVLDKLQQQQQQQQVRLGPQQAYAAGAESVAQQSQTALAIKQQLELQQRVMSSANASTFLAPQMKVMPQMVPCTDATVNLATVPQPLAPSAHAKNVNLNQPMSPVSIISLLPQAAPQMTYMETEATGPLNNTPTTTLHKPTPLMFPAEESVNDVKFFVERTAAESGADVSKTILTPMMPPAPPPTAHKPPSGGAFLTSTHELNQTSTGEVASETKERESSAPPANSPMTTSTVATLPTTVKNKFVVETVTNPNDSM
ncbi:Myeloid lymphoid or mixed-lineage leukemia 2 [Cichlidogyrus casuarinus]|uniref:Myeloid lymphoid or mixed-lineage leukemia 2 n=1 Tax=Cichlidogyrus casuarinus TaxID=1844966 RepID=A0ABD2PNF0_9PLAT